MLSGRGASARPELAVFAAWLERTYGLALSDVRPTDVPGYWERVGGGATIRYLDPRDARGRFVSPFRTWEIAKDEEKGTT